MKFFSVCLVIFIVLIPIGVHSNFVSSTPAADVRITTIHYQENSYDINKEYIVIETISQGDVIELDFLFSGYTNSTMGNLVLNLNGNLVNYTSVSDTPKGYPIHISSVPFHIGILYLVDEPIKLYYDSVTIFNSEINSQEIDVHIHEGGDNSIHQSDTSLQISLVNDTYLLGIDLIEDDGNDIQTITVVDNYTLFTFIQIIDHQVVNISDSQYQSLDNSNKIISSYLYELQSSSTVRSFDFSSELVTNTVEVSLNFLIPSLFILSIIVIRRYWS